MNNSTGQIRGDYKYRQAVVETVQLCYEKDCNCMEPNSERHLSKKEKFANFLRIYIRLQHTYDFIDIPHDGHPNIMFVVDKEYGDTVLKVGRNKTIGGVPVEITALYKLMDVPHTMRVLKYHSWADDVEPDNNYAYLMDHLPQDDIYHCIGGNVQKTQVFMRQLLETLDSYLDLDMFHRDIKISNLAWNDDEEELTVFDFNFAICCDSKETREDFAGTDLYASPEMENDFGYNWKTDVYSAGVVFGLLLSGKTIYDIDDGDVAKWRRGAPKWLKNKHKKRGLDLVGKMLTKIPADRPSFRECLDHPFFQTPDSEKAQPPEPEIPK